MPDKKIAIVSSCSLSGFGLKKILVEYFGKNQINHFFTAKELMAHNPENFDLFFIPAEPVLLNYEFFLPRKLKTIILTNDYSNNLPFQTLKTDNQISFIIDDIQNILDNISKNENNNSQEELSNREIEVLKLITKGMINKEIAEELFICLNPVFTHRKNITPKLGLTMVSALTFYAMMTGLITS